MTALNVPDTPAVGELYGSLGTVWRWDGARWASTSGMNGARGVVARGSLAPTSPLVITNPTNVALTNTVTVDVVAGRTYRAVILIRAISGSGVALAIQFDVDGVNQGDRYQWIAGAYQQLYSEFTWQATVTKAQTMRYRGGPSGVGTLTLYMDGLFYVEDITYEAGSGGPGGGERPGVSLGHSVAQSIPHATWTPLTFDVEYSDIGAMHDPASPTRITIWETGRYLCTFRISFFASAGGTQRLARIMKNGSAAFLAAHSLGLPSASLEAFCEGTVVLQLAAGDYLQCPVYQDSGAALSVQGNNSAGELIHFDVVRI